jgi:hypothetical protein
MGEPNPLKRLRGQSGATLTTWNFRTVLPRVPAPETDVLALEIADDVQTALYQFSQISTALKAES